MSLQNHANFSSANDHYAEQFGDKGSLSGPPALKVCHGLSSTPIAKSVSDSICLHS
jgi:hypothetical protein